MVGVLVWPRPGPGTLPSLWPAAESGSSLRDEGAAVRGSGSRGSALALVPVPALVPAPASRFERLGGACR